MLQFFAASRISDRRVSRLRSQRRIATVVLVTLAAFLSQIGATNSAYGKSGERPNIVLIMADDLGYMDVHCYGNERQETPRLDRLASQGMRFTDGYSAAPVCTPTRAAIMTGLSPARLAITNHAPGNGPRFRPKGSNLQSADWTTYLDLDHVTVAERLRDAGYATGFVGKWHLSHRKGKNAKGSWEPQLRAEYQGFDLNVGGCSYGGPPSYFEPYRIPNIKPLRDGAYLPDRLADECIDFVKKQQEKPFFLCWWPYSVHYPFQAPEALSEKYKSRVGRNLKNPVYAGMIEGMDRSIGRFLDQLDELKLSDNTLVIFTSDNGAFGADSRPLRGAKGYLFEGGIRVPWIARWPGVIKPGVESAEPVISTDLYYTLLDAAGIQPPADLPRDGASLKPLFQGEETLDREAIYFHYPNYAFHKGNRPGSAIRAGDYKLILRYDDGSLELYNLKDDLGETNNLADAKPDLARKLHGRLKQWLDETKAKLPTRVEVND